MELVHIAIPVRNLPDAIFLFTEYFGYRVCGNIEDYSWGTVVFLTQKGVEVKLQLSCPNGRIGFCHFAHLCFSVPDPKILAVKIKEKIPRTEINEVNGGKWMCDVPFLGMNIELERE